MRIRFFALALTVAFVCFFATVLCAAGNLTTLRLPRVADGRSATLTDTDTDAVIDSIVVEDETAVFPSDRYNPCVVKVSVGDDVYGFFVLNDSPITLDAVVEDIPGGVCRRWQAYGGYNDSIIAVGKRISEALEVLHDNPTDALRDSVVNANRAFLISKIEENADNLLGYRLLLMAQSELSFDDVENLLGRNPALKNYRQVDAMVARKKALRDTQPGSQYRDFYVSYDGIGRRLSDVVGHGDYVMLDFWAFWCGPCRDEMPYIKEAFERFSGTNFKIIGIAISDDPAKDLECAERLGLPWEIWVNCSGADQLYSISAIPHLILIGPDGTILARGFRGENIIPVLSEYLGEAL